MHFLTLREADRATSLGRVRAAVRVRFRRVGTRRVLIVQPEICVLKPDVMLAELPKDVAVVSEEGDVIKPTGAFLVTVESFNPWHMLVAYATDHPRDPRVTLRRF